MKRTNLGAPPSADEARMDLAPTAPPSLHVPTPMPALAPEAAPRLDGRSMRRSGRTLQFATRVSPEFDARVRRIAIREGLLLVEVLERALDAYEQRNKVTDI